MSAPTMEVVRFKVHKALCEKYPESSVDEIGHSLADFLNQLVREGLLKE